MEQGWPSPALPASPEWSLCWVLSQDSGWLPYSLMPRRGIPGPPRAPLCLRSASSWNIILPVLTGNSRRPGAPRRFSSAFTPLLRTCPSLPNPFLSCVPGDLGLNIFSSNSTISPSGKASLPFSVPWSHESTASLLSFKS